MPCSLKLFEALLTISKFQYKTSKTFDLWESAVPFYSHKWESKIHFPLFILLLLRTQDLKTHQGPVSKGQHTRALSSAHELLYDTDI